MAVAEGQVLWQPSPGFAESTNTAVFTRWMEERHDRRFGDYNQLWRWSVENLEDFWASVWTYYRVRASQPYESVLTSHSMPGAHWFEGARLNFAEHALSRISERPAIVHKSEGRPVEELSWPELRRQVAVVAARLRALGVGRGDRVAAYLPNIPEAVVGFLATASLGAIWASCSPDFGIRSVVDRLRQIEPKVLLMADGYRYGGREFSRMDRLPELQRQMPSLRRVIVIPHLDPEAGAGLSGVERWDVSGRADLTFEQVGFEDPLWVLYSSGTTGMPKGLVHGHGGILLSLFLSLDVHFDHRPEDRVFWFTTTGWVMWNITVSCLLLGSTIVLYDGSPGHPGADALWAVAAETKTTFLGTSAAYIGTCAKAGAEPGRDHDLSRLRALCYTGSPLVPELWGWVYEHVKSDLWMSTVSGGTDVCVPFVGGLPTLPVRAGEFQCRCLGIAVEAWDEAGQAHLDQVGELVVTEPMPSMPVHFWNDPDGRRYLESYFGVFPGAWRHGDWIKITGAGTAVIYGRSDSTINRMGVRIGSSEIYRAVEDMPDVLDSLVVDLTGLGRESWMPLFLVLREGVELDEPLKERVRGLIREGLSPRHVPDAILQISSVPRTINNKKLEVPIRKILLGQPPASAVNRDSMSNPEALDFFIELAGRIRAETPPTSGAGGSDGPHQPA